MCQSEASALRGFWLWSIREGLRIPQSVCGFGSATQGYFWEHCEGDEGSQSSSSATSELCDDVRCLEAVYWDFINGVPRGDLPSTAFTIPSDDDESS